MDLMLHVQVLGAERRIIDGFGPCPDASSGPDADCRRLLTGALTGPSLRTAVAPVTTTLGGVTEGRQHWSGVVRRGAVDTTPGITPHPSARNTSENHPRIHA